MEAPDRAVQVLRCARLIPSSADPRDVRVVSVTQRRTCKTDVEVSRTAVRSDTTNRAVFV